MKTIADVIDAGMRLVEKDGFQMGERRAGDYARRYPLGHEMRHFWFQVAQAISEVRDDLDAGDEQRQAIREGGR